MLMIFSDNRQSKVISCIKLLYSLFCNNINKTNAPQFLHDIFQVTENDPRRGIYSSGKGDFFPLPYSYLKVGMYLLDCSVHDKMIKPLGFSLFF